MSRVKVIGTTLFLIVFLVLPASALAYNAAVLGESTSTTTPSLPATAEGPGFILPDSPFFFLDEAKQRLRLLLSFSPEARAKARVDIAGERLAELRIMLAGNNIRVAQRNLDEIAENLQEAADALEEARLSGRNVSETAKYVNESIRRKEDYLEILATQVTGDTRDRVNMVQAVAFKSKVRAADSLRPDLIQTEILDDLTRRALRQVRQASDSAISIQNTLDELSRQSVIVATKSSSPDAKRLIESQNISLKAAKEAASAAQKAALEFQRSTEAVNQIRAQSNSSVSPK